MIESSYFSGKIQLQALIHPPLIDMMGNGEILSGKEREYDRVRGGTNGQTCNLTSLVPRLSTFLVATDKKLGSLGMRIQTYQKRSIGIVWADNDQSIVE